MDMSPHGLWNKRTKAQIKALLEEDLTRRIEVIREQIDLERTRPVEGKRLPVDEFFGATFYIFKLGNKASDIRLLDTLDFIYTNEIRLLMEMAFWQGYKIKELKHKGVIADKSECLGVAVHLRPYKRPNWLFDRIAKHGVIVL